LHADFTQAAKALYQHWRGLEGIVAIDEIVEKLVVTRSAEVKEFFNGALFSTSEAPPISLEVEDTTFKIGEG
jgi:hypothetical protein